MREHQNNFCHHGHHDTLSLGSYLGSGAPTHAAAKEEHTMTVRALLLSSLILSAPCAALAANPEAPVRATVQAFYTAYDEGFTGSVAFAAEDWNHINPQGGWTRGRKAVLEEVRAVHATFLKGVTDTVDEMVVRFASPEVAVVTVTSTMSLFHTPDHVEHPHDHCIRTFVVAKRHGHWLVVQDQNTNIRSPAAPPPRDAVKN